MHRRRAVMHLLAWCAVAAVLTASSGLESAAAQAAGSGRLEMATFWSQMLGTRKRAMVWLPPSYSTDSRRRYPVAYYLHGLGGSETSWTALGALDRTLDSLIAAGLPEIIVVMPDGDDGWYTTWNWLGDYAACRRDFTARDDETVDSFCVPWPKYDDYVVRDVVGFVDSTFRTIADRPHRAIAGLGMGGYGALALALAYPDVFVAAASHAGLLSPFLLSGTPEQPRYATSLDELHDAWGRLFQPMTRAFGQDSAAWRTRDPAHLAARLNGRTPGMMPALMADVGTDDELLGNNRVFDAELRRWGISLRYSEREGHGSWDYGRRQAVESLRWIGEQVGRSLR